MITETGLCEHVEFARPLAPKHPALRALGRRRPAALARALARGVEERAAIMEYDGGMTRARAEHEAWRLLRERVAGDSPR